MLVVCVCASICKCVCVQVCASVCVCVYVCELGSLCSVCVCIRCIVLCECAWGNGCVVPTVQLPSPHSATNIKSMSKEELHRHMLMEKYASIWRTKTKKGKADFQWLHLFTHLPVVQAFKNPCCSYVDLFQLSSLLSSSCLFVFFLFCLFFFVFHS